MDSNKQPEEPKCYKPLSNVHVCSLKEYNAVGLWVQAAAWTAYNHITQTSYPNTWLPLI
jgi:hypothetical protein